MSRQLSTLLEVADNYLVMVFDQWGVLHNGSIAYSRAIDTLDQLKQRQKKLCVLSNSGKRAEANLQRIAAMGFDPTFFTFIMTSGEALWHDIDQKMIPYRRFFVIERAQGDALDWRQGLEIQFDGVDTAEAVLLMGLPDGDTLDQWMPTLQHALNRSLPIYCSNPDRCSPRHNGFVISPGALAHVYQQMGGKVVYYGKPHQAIFDMLQCSLQTPKILMIGDSLEHDIMGAHDAGWDSALICGGLYRDHFANQPVDYTLQQLTTKHNTPMPTYTLWEIA